jgi:hypothetical protein
MDNMKKFWLYQAEVNGTKFKGIAESEHPSGCFPIGNVDDTIAKSFSNVYSYNFDLVLEICEDDFMKMKKTAEASQEAPNETEPISEQVPEDTQTGPN